MSPGGGGQREVFPPFLTASRKGDGVACMDMAPGWASPQRCYTGPPESLEGGELLPWWPVCSKFLPGEVGDIYTQGQGESGQTAEGRRTGTAWVRRDHWLRCVRAGEAGHVLFVSQHFHLCLETVCFPFKGRFGDSGASCLLGVACGRPLRSLPLPTSA